MVNKCDIPLVEVRKVRPCSVCYNRRFFTGTMYQCSIECDENRFYLHTSDPSNCGYNFTKSETLQILKQHNAGEQLVRLIELRIDDLDGQLSEGEIKLSLHHALTCELRWILQSIEDFKQQPRSGMS